METQPGVLIVLSGPSGVGKGTLRGYLAQALPELRESVSVTTREQRPGEQEGIHYFFVSRERFDAMITTGDLLEWAEFAGNYYGTPRAIVQQTLQSGQSILLEIDVQGALSIKALFSEAQLVFIEPPSFDTLAARLQERSTNTHEDIQQRLAIAKEELSQKCRFDYVLINDNLAVCQEELKALIVGLLPHPLENASPT